MQWYVPPIGERPHQPISFRFPQREFGQKTVTKRSFQAKWFSKWPWLHYSYNEDSDSVYCLHCIKVYSQNKLLGVRVKLRENLHFNWIRQLEASYLKKFASWLLYIAMILYNIMFSRVLLMKLIKISEAII